MGLGENHEGIEKYKLAVTKESQGVQVQHREHNNIAITMYGARWVLETLERKEHSVKCIIVQLLCCTLETNTKQY